MFQSSNHQVRSNAKDIANAAKAPLPSQHKEDKEDDASVQFNRMLPIYYKQWTDVTSTEDQQTHEALPDARTNGPLVCDADDWLCVFVRAIRSPRTIVAASANRCNMFSTPLDLMLSS